MNTESKPESKGRTTYYSMRLIGNSGCGLISGTCFPTANDAELVRARRDDADEWEVVRVEVTPV